MISFWGELPDVAAETAPRGHAALDPLQQDMDPKPFVTSRGKGPAPRRKISSHMPAKGRVNVHHILCLLVLGVSVLSR